jgi:hypothetical protein
VETRARQTARHAKTPEQVNWRRPGMKVGRILSLTKQLRTRTLPILYWQSHILEISDTILIARKRAFYTGRAMKSRMVIV